MADTISCICGYRGPSVSYQGRTVCPICRGRVQSLDDAPQPAPPRPDSRGSARRPAAGPNQTGAAPAGDHNALTGADPDWVVGDDPLRPVGPPVFRIPCPKGHVMKAVEDMIGQPVVCPECNSPFVLRAADSLEFRREQRLRQREAEERRAQMWLKTAIWAAAFIALSFIVMIWIALNPDFFRGN